MVSMVNLYETPTAKGSEVNERTKYRIKKSLRNKTFSKFLVNPLLTISPKKSQFRTLIVVVVCIYVYKHRILL